MARPKPDKGVRRDPANRFGRALFLWSKAMDEATHGRRRERVRPLVTLIGAGPGDPELMTLKAARALGAADVVLVDELVNRGCLAHVRSDARIIEVGKR